MANQQVISALKASTFPFTWTIQVLKDEIVERGRICPDETINNKIERAGDYEVGEILDVLWVATEQKPLAMTIRNMDYWRRWRSTHESYAMSQITARNIAQKIAYDQGVRCIYYSGRKGYNLFYYRESDPKGLDDALKLMAFTTYHAVLEGKFDFEHFSPEVSYAIGKLLGYSLENIKYFILTRLDFKVTDTFVTETDKKLSKLKLKLSDFDTKKVSILKKPIEIPLKTRKYTKK